MAAFTRAEAHRGTSQIQFDSMRFYAAMASRMPARPDQPGAVDPVLASQASSTPFLLRG